MALSPASPPQSNRKTIFLSIGLIVLLGVIVYANSLKGQFVWDDEVLVQYNPYIKNWSHLPRVLTTRLGSVAKEAGAFYRPVQAITYMTDYSFWRLNVLGFHLTNMLLHILAALGLYWLVRLLFDKNKLALITALLFVAHPIHTEAVSYISGRADSLVALFIFLSFAFYLKHGKARKASTLLLMGVCYILAMLSKELSLILPFVILFYHYAFKKAVDKKAFFILAGVLGAYILWRLTVVGGGSLAEGTPPSFADRLPGVFIALFGYFRLLLWPVNLHMEYGGLLFPWSEPQAAMGIIALVIISAIVFIRRKNDPFLLFAAGWFFITLLPSSNLLFPINAYMAEHWLYLPSVGFFLLIARFFSTLIEKEKKGPAITILVVLLGSYSVLTIRQNTVWSNGINFYKQMIIYAPQSSRLYNNLAKAYHDDGKDEELIGLLTEALKRQPDNALAHNNLGNAYKTTGQIEKAKQSYLTSIKIDPTNAGPYYNLSTIYYDVYGEKDKAIELLNKAVDISPHFAQSYNKLGIIYLKDGDSQKAIKLLSRALELDPDNPEIRHSLGYTYVQLGDRNKAAEMYRSAIQVNPNYVQAYHDLAIIYMQMQKFDLAIQYYDRAAAMGYRDDALRGALEPYR